MPPFSGDGGPPPRLGGGGGAVRGMVFVGTPLGGFGLMDRGDGGFFFNTDKLVPDPDEVRLRLGGGGGGPLLPKRVTPDDGLDIFRPTEDGGAGGLARSGGGGGPDRKDPDEVLPTLKELPPLVGGGGGTFPRTGVGGPARVGGGGGRLIDLLLPGVGRGNCGGAGREELGTGGLGPLVEGGEAGLLNLFTGERLPPLLKP